MEPGSFAGLFWTPAPCAAQQEHECQLHIFSLLAAAFLACRRVRFTPSDAIPVRHTQSTLLHAADHRVALQEERETERQRDRQRDRDRQTERETHTDTERGRERERERKKDPQSANQHALRSGVVAAYSTVVRNNHAPGMPARIVQSYEQRWDSR